MCSDSDYRGLEKVADDLLKGNLTTGNVGADLALSFVPGVGTVMSGYDAVKGFANGANDLFHGRWGSGLKNLGSGILNTGITALDVLSLGIGGRLVGGGLKALGRGGRAVAAMRAAKGLKGAARARAIATAGRAGGSRLMRMSKALHGAGSRVQSLERVAQNGIARRLAGEGGEKMWRMIHGGMTVDPRAAKALTGGGKGIARVGGWVARHPYWTTFVAGQAAGSLVPETAPEGEEFRQTYSPVVRQTAFGPGSPLYQMGASGYRPDYRNMYWQPYQTPQTFSYGMRQPHQHRGYR